MRQDTLELIINRLRLLSIFILFIVIEYTMRTLIKSYEYHEVGFFLEFLPSIIATLISGVIYRKTILNKHFGRSYLKLVVTSIGGLLVAKALLFIRWYWFIAPEYRSIPGDMYEGLGWVIFFSTIGAIIISLFYMVEILVMKAFQKQAEY